MNDANKDNEQHDAALQPEHQTFTDAQVASFREFSQEPDCIDKLVDLLAPSIWENTDVKKGILTQLFGGVSKELK